MGSISEDISVMVIGAGSGGRLIAQGLRKTGIPCTVFEQDASLDARARDWNFGIYWAQTPLEDCLPEDVRDKIITAQVDNMKPTADDYLPIFNSETAELLHKVPAPYYLRLRRREFARVMGHGIDIRYNKRLVAIDTTSGPGVTATFADGTQHTASLLVGAEGAHSQVRDFLLGPEQGALLQSPIMLAILLTKLPAEHALALRALHPRICATFHPNGTFAWFGVHDAYDKPNPADWTFCLMQSWLAADSVPPAPASVLPTMKRHAAAFASPFRAATEAVPADTPAWANFLPYWPTQSWAGHAARGRVTLAGDAAHPMTPHRGQGLNNAILDCAQLVEQVRVMGEERGVGALREAVERYEEEVWARGREAVESSLENSVAVHDWERLGESPLVRGGMGRVVGGRGEEGA